MEAADVEVAFREATSEPEVPPVVVDEEEEEGEVEEDGSLADVPVDSNLEREGLAFVAGYVAAKCRHIDGTLGKPTRTAPETSVPSTWLRVVSRGGLMIPSEQWMSVVEGFEVTFNLVMGRGACQESGIVRRLMELLLEKEPGLDRRIARKLVSTRLHIRLRWLNQAMAEVAAERRKAKK